MEKLENRPYEDLKQVYEILEESYQASYEKVKEEQRRVVEGFDKNDVCGRILLKMRNMNNKHVKRIVPDNE